MIKADEKPTLPKIELAKIIARLFVIHTDLILDNPKKPVQDKKLKENQLSRVML